MLGRYSSAIRAACANERSCGSVRGAISDGCPYRDRQLTRPKDSSNEPKVTCGPTDSGVKFRYDTLATPNVALDLLDRDFGLHVSFRGVSGSLLSKPAYSARNGSPSAGNTSHSGSRIDDSRCATDR